MSDKMEQGKLFPEEKEVINITLDTSFKDVLELDEKGARLSWVKCEEEGKFPAYSREEVGKLSSWNRQSYQVSLGAHTLAKKDVPRQTPGLKISGRLASATTKLNVNYPEGYRDKWHCYWERADGVQSSARAGYVPVNINDPEDAGIEAFQVNPEGYPMIRTDFEDELILMKEPKENNDERIRQVGEESNRRNRKVTEDAILEMEKVGGVPYVPKKGDERRYSWRETKKT
jgi:hypothetical protein